mmetsp:Transcript_50862/g.118325  ORF Transcript_50862/g.118325 Transcript_50862/m.118325 type:complete len:127 (-) Transcript_50862:3-383(-)
MSVVADVAAKGNATRVDVAQRGVALALVSLVKPLERLKAEETIWMARTHVEEHSKDAASPIHPTRWDLLQHAVEKAAWLAEEAPEEWKILGRLREEVLKDRAGRPFSAKDWNAYVNGAVSALESVK